MKLLKGFTGLWLMSSMLLCGAGCELLSAPDRSQIPYDLSSSSSSGSGGSSSSTSSSSGSEGGGGSGGGTPVTMCGDGIVADAEGCDDGNTTANDGCSDTCTEETGYTCAGEPSACITTCGDGIAAGKEGCDDDNKDGGDGCSGMCAVEAGWMCAGAPSVCAPICGDGVQLAGETCDDANVNAGDGCSVVCAVEAGWTCTGTPSVCTTFCGDGKTAGTEACDDGNNALGDGCTDTCVVEPGYSCTVSPAVPSVCATTCGDGKLGGTETCDDGNIQAADGCSAVCAPEAGWKCMGMPGGLTPCATICGDGIPAGPEGCDDGVALSGDGCAGDCTVEYGYTCTKDPLNPPSVCVTTCGDGKVAGAELCDDGNAQSGDGCDASCAIENGYVCSTAPMAASVCSTVCGDGIIVAATEQCDDMNTADGDGCSAACAIDTGWACNSAPSICKTICGDSMIVAPEQCDDGNTIPGDGCDDICQVDAGWTCNGLPSQCVTTCGDGVAAGTEQCDDGSLVNGDGCSDVCSVEVGYACSGTPSACSPLCGDSLILAGEACDDGNVASFDGCSSSCVVEAGFTCSGTPSSCASFCGDGTLAKGPEQCDDGNLAVGDCCSDLCQIEAGCEVEPNNSIATANDFDLLAPAGQIKGFVSPSTEFDVFKVNVPAGKKGVLQIEVLDGFMGTTCASNLLDSLINVRKADGTLVGFDDDNGPGFCSLATASSLVSGDYFVELSDSLVGGQQGFDYVLKITKTLYTCGDGVINPTEQCDDGNAFSGDGCSNQCVLELLAEVEPNNLCGVGLGTYSAPVLLSGAITPVADQDWFAFQVPGVADVKIESFDGNGPSSCVGIDNEMFLFKSDCTTLLAYDDQDGINSCAMITSTTDAGARGLLPGQTYYLRVQDWFNNNAIPAYQVFISFNALCGNGIKEGVEDCDAMNLPTANCDASCKRIAVCGDGLVDSPETCEDFNTVDGDGCSSQCFVEGVIGEVDPNNTFAEANASPVQLTGDAIVRGTIPAIGDVDNYRLVLSQPSAVRIETFDGSLIDCAAGFATTLRLYNSGGAQIYTDATAGIQSCSSLSVYLNAGTYYVRVEETDNNAILGAYGLEVDVQVMAGTETEPNDFQAAANSFTSFTTDFYIQGSHQVALNDDWFAINVPAGWSVKAELIEGSAETCESGGMDSTMYLHNAAGVQLVYDDDDGRGACSYIDGTGSTPADLGAHNMAAGTYYLKVDDYSTGVNAQFDYRLVVTIRAP